MSSLFDCWKASCLVGLLVLGKAVPAAAGENDNVVSISDGKTVEQTGNPRNEKVLSPVPGIALLSTGGALLLASVVTGALALKLNSDLKDECPGGGCFAPYHDDVDRLDALAAVTDAFIPLSAALLIAGAFTLVAAKRTQRKYGDKNAERAGRNSRLEVAGSSVIWRF